MSAADYLGIVGAIYIAPHLSKMAGCIFGIVFCVSSLLLKMNGA